MDKQIQMDRPTVAHLLATAEALIPSLIERAPGDEKNGRVSRDTVNDLVRTGLMRAALPASWNGWEMPFSALIETVSTLARGDHSVGWIYGLFSLHTHHLALFDYRAQQDVWGSNPDAILASTYSPYGTAVSCPGGYQFKGTLPFSSGCDYGDWFLLGALVDGDPTKFLTFLLPAKDVQIVSDWDVFGLKATGSKSVVVEEVFVPSYRTVPFGPDTESFDFPGFQVNSGSRFRIPYLLVFNRCVTACSIGSLQAMIEAFVEYNRPKMSIITGKQISTLPDTQLALGEAVATVEEMKIMARHDLDTLEEAIADGRGLDPRQVNVFRYRAQEVSVRCLKAATGLYELAGGGGLYESRPLARIYRNLIGARNHPACAVFRETARAIGAEQFTG